MADQTISGIINQATANVQRRNDAQFQAINKYIGSDSAQPDGPPAEPTPSTDPSVRIKARNDDAFAQWNKLVQD